MTRSRGIGLTWNPLIHWPRSDVLDYIRSRGDILHAAYRIYGSSRVSCAFCVLASQADLLSATRCDDNAAIYREIVELEIRSTFSFQSKRWLGDVAPGLLDAPARCRSRGHRRRLPGWRGGRRPLCGADPATDPARAGVSAVGSGATCLRT